MFGKFDKVTLENCIKAANSNLDQFITDMMSKANKIQDKVVGELSKDKFGDYNPVVD